MAGVRTVVAEPDTGYELTVVDLDPLRATIWGFGEFDLAARKDLTEVLQQQEDACRRFVRLDLSQVTLLDRTCLGVLVVAHHRFLERHGLLVLTGVDENLARILKVTGLDDSLFIVASDWAPLASQLMARPARRPKYPNQRQAPAASFGSLMAVPDQHTAAAARDLVHATTTPRKAVS